MRKSKGILLVRALAKVAFVLVDAGKRSARWLGISLDLAIYGSHIHLLPGRQCEGSLKAQRFRLSFPNC